MADIDDPFKRSDATTMRPRPGAGKWGSNEATRARPASPSPAARAEPIGAAARDWLGVGLNPLLQAASPLLLLAGQLRGAISAMDVAGLRQHALDEMRRFEDRARAAGVANEIVLTARYVLCATLDEAVLSTPWGSQSEWAQHPLLVTLHREAWGGEKFFEVLDRISRDPGRHIDLMELQYLCISFGFAGNINCRNAGTSVWPMSSRTCIARFATIAARPIPNCHCAGAVSKTGAILLSGMSRGGLSAPPHLRCSRSPTRCTTRSGQSGGAGARAACESGARGVRVVDAPPAAGPTLKQLLKNEESSGALSVEEQGGRTVVTLLASDLFASGSASVNPDYEATLRAIAAALNQVPGPGAG